MKQTREQRRKRQKASILVLFVFLLLVPLLAVAQSIESARKKLEAGDYAGAEEELNQILEEESENIEARALLSEIEKMRKKEKAELLTQRALIEIDNRNFETAFLYLEEAILLDPENIRARKLYLSIHEIAKVEEESRQEERTAVSQGESKEEEPKELPKQEEETETSALKEGEFIVRVSTILTIANSNNLDYFDSKVSLLSGRVDTRYYFKFLDRRFGLSLDYSGSFLKASGDENIEFTIHRMNVSARFRTYFFDDRQSRMIAGARLNYHLFILHNRAEHGVYNFTRVYGPSLGVFISDPVVYRFLKKKLFENLGFEAELNYLLLLKRGDPPKALELSIGSYYDLSRFRFGLGYRRYSIRNSDVKENYNDIELSVGYRF